MSAGTTEVQRQEHSYLGETVSEGIKRLGHPSLVIYPCCVSPIDAERRIIGDSEDNRQQVVLFTVFA